MRITAAIAALLVSVSPALSDLDALAKEMYDALHADRQVLTSAMREDCTFRHPGRHDSIERCVEEQFNAYGLMRRMFYGRPNYRSPGVVAYCMDQNRSLHGFAWRDVSRCYERMILALGGQ